jgi:hypothetical protein
LLGLEHRGQLGAQPFEPLHFLARLCGGDAAGLERPLRRLGARRKVAQADLAAFDLVLGAHRPRLLLGQAPAESDDFRLPLAVAGLLGLQLSHQLVARQRELLDLTPRPLGLRTGGVERSLGRLGTYREVAQVVLAAFDLTLRPRRSCLLLGEPQGELLARFVHGGELAFQIRLMGARGLQRVAQFRVTRLRRRQLAARRVERRRELGDAWLQLGAHLAQRRQFAAQAVQLAALRGQRLALGGGLQAGVGKLAIDAIAFDDRLPQPGLKPPDRRVPFAGQARELRCERLARREQGCRLGG